jgi:hypothetical protein
MCPLQGCNAGWQLQVEAPWVGLQCLKQGCVGGGVVLGVSCAKLRRRYLLLLL